MLLLLLSESLSIPCSNAFAGRIFSLTGITLDRYQASAFLIKAEMQVKVYLTFDCIQFYHYIKEKKKRHPTLCRQFRKALLEKATERVKIFYSIMGQKETFHHFLLTKGNMFCYSHCTSVLLSIYIYFFFLLCPQNTEVSGPGIKAPPKPKQMQ